MKTNRQKADQQKTMSYTGHRSLVKTIGALAILTLSTPVFSNQFVFPENISLHHNSMVAILPDAKLVKDVNVRKSPQLADILKSSIVASPPLLQQTDSADALVLRRVSNDGKHARYDQYFNGNKVFGRQVMAHLDQQGEVLERVTGSFITGLQGVAIDSEARFDESQALEIARQQLDQEHNWNLENSQTELVIYHKPGEEDFKPRLAYIVNFVATSETADPTRPFIVIDAQTQAVIDQWEGLNT